jgi:hydroxypyruvate isomerase
MPRFAANITMMYTEYPVLERIERAAAGGFKAVELLFPYTEDIDALGEALDRHGVSLINMNLPPGDWAAGERGIAANPDRTSEFADGVGRAIEIATRLKVPKINCLAGITCETASIDAQYETLQANLMLAAELTERAGILQMVEPINNFDIPGYILNRPSAGFKLIEEIGHPNLCVEYDVYHAQRTEGNLAATLRERFSEIGHIQIADSPARNQPGTGEINYPYIFSVIDEIGYNGWVALEYRPSGQSEESIGWLREWGYFS